jgi:hypothetical protein
MYNLDDYEDVATLNRWFIENYPMGRSALITEMHDPDKGFIRIRAELYRDITDAIPAVTNIAFGNRDLYNRNMARFYVEDTATSALGRAIILLKGSQKTATRESMEEVSKTSAIIQQTKAKMAETSKEYVPVPVEDDPWTIKDRVPVATMQEAVETVKQVLGGTAVDESCRHGNRIWKTGTTKAGRAWGHWRCPEQGHPMSDPCDPIWYEISSDGKWKPRAAK